jgi:hypothetical protein
MGYFVAKLTKIQGFRNWKNFVLQLIYISFCGFRIPYLDKRLMDCMEVIGFWKIILNQRKIAASIFLFVAP